MSKEIKDDSVQRDQLPGTGTGISSFRFYSLGIVAANKKLSSDYIEVVPVEHFSFVDGEITDNKEELEEESQTFTEEKWKVKLDTTPSIMARWLSLANTNRITSPDVRRGEVVMIYQFGDADEYWWTDLLTDDKKTRKTRRLETVVFAISNNPKENTPDDSDSTYWVEFSTHRQIVHLHTSKSNKEPFEYDIQINTKDGRIVIKDDDENYIFLDSAERRIKLHNKDTSYVDIDKKDITLHSLNKVHVKTKHFIVDAKETITTDTKKYTETTRTYKMQTQEYRINSTSVYYVNTPDARHSTDITAGANISAGGNVHGSTYSGGHHT